MRASNTITCVAACGFALLALLGGFAARAAPDRSDDLESLRRAGDLTLQRRHMWSVIVKIAGSAAEPSTAAFDNWYGESEVFAIESGERAPLGLRGFAHPAPLDASKRSAGGHGPQSADAPLITYTLYNSAAYRHIRGNQLYRRAALELLRRNEAGSDVRFAAPAVADFPTDAVVLKTAWWAVASDGITALPVWDPDRNPARADGNGYAGWQRVVAVDAGDRDGVAPAVDVDFLGRRFDAARRVQLGSLHHLSVDADLATRIMQDRDASKAVLIALGRPLQAGDYLVLVAMHAATREISDWTWATLWWHDVAERGVFAADRPDAMAYAWRSYLMQVAFDAQSPRAADGGPHVCFNPWFEARFPDGGQGGGVVSNCVACHQRASYPPVPSLPVTRGAPDVVNDAAYERGRVRTSLLWSLALHARP